MKKDVQDEVRRFQQWMMRVLMKSGLPADLSKEAVGLRDRPLTAEEQRDAERFAAACQRRTRP